MMDSSYAESFYTKANLLSAMGRNKEAIVYGQKAIELYPDSIPYLYLTSEIYRKMRQYDEALLYSGKIAQAKGASESLKNATLLHKAQIYKEKGDNDSTIMLCQKLLNIKEFPKEFRLPVHQCLISATDKESIPQAIEKMMKDLGSSSYSANALATLQYNTIGMYDKANKHKEKAFELHKKNQYDNKAMQVDQYIHADVLVKAYEYFDPKDAGSMPLQYVFQVSLPDSSGNYQPEYVIRVEYVLDVFKQHKSQMAVMATLKKDGFRTYWETFSEVKSTPYQKWIEFANNIIDGNLKVGSSTLLGGDGVKIDTGTSVTGGEEVFPQTTPKETDN